MKIFIPPGGGYGRIWEAMYEGSMVGLGPEVFCIWPYIIAKMRMSGGVVTVMLNPALLKEVFGVDEDFVKRGVERLCAVDESSKNGTEEEGRRLKHVSGFMYQVVNGADYIAIRSKEKHAEAQARYREKKRPRKSQKQVRNEYDARERRGSKAYDNGDNEAGDRIAAEGLPQ